jgi:hypothetical protein
MSVIDRVSLQDQIAEVQREIDMRKRVYVRLVDSGKMSPYEAEVRTLNMAAVLQTLENVRGLRAEINKEKRYATAGRED